MCYMPRRLLQCEIIVFLQKYCCEPIGLIKTNNNVKKPDHFHVRGYALDRNGFLPFPKTFFSCNVTYHGPFTQDNAQAETDSPVWEYRSE